MKNVFNDAEMISEESTIVASGSTDSISLWHWIVMEN